MPNFCTSCGEKIENNVKFCPSCGYNTNQKKDKVSEEINNTNFFDKSFLSKFTILNIIVIIILSLIYSSDNFGYKLSTGAYDYDTIISGDKLMLIVFLRLIIILIGLYKILRNINILSIVLSVIFIILFFIIDLPGSEINYINLVNNITNSDLKDLLYNFMIYSILGSLSIGAGYIYKGKILSLVSIIGLYIYTNFIINLISFLNTIEINGKEFSNFDFTFKRNLLDSIFNWMPILFYIISFSILSIAGILTMIKFGKAISGNKNIDYNIKKIYEIENDKMIILDNEIQKNKLVKSLEYLLLILVGFYILYIYLFKFFFA